jgi:UDP-arabinose 4-epimerase
VCDLAAAHVEALRHLNAGNASLTLNLGTGKAASVRSIIAAVERITGRAVPLAARRAQAGTGVRARSARKGARHAARRPGDPPMLVADASRARKLIGFTPRLSDLDTIVTTAWKARVKAARQSTSPCKDQVGEEQVAR